MGEAPARAVRPGLLPLLRAGALPLALFSGVAHLGAAVVVGLMVLGAVSGGVGGAALSLWAVFSLLVSLGGYRWMEERRRRRAASADAAHGMQELASRVIALYPRPVEDTAIAAVFEAYRRAQASLEEGNYRAVGEAVERGIELADELLERDGGRVREKDGEAEGGASWK